MTGNTLTQNPITGTNAYANNTYGTPQQGFWGNAGGYGFTTPQFQQQVPTLFTQQYGTVNPLFTPTMQTGIVGQPQNQWQGGFATTPHFGFQGIQTPVQQTVPQQVLNTIQQTVPQQVLNTILQTTPPQVLPFILNALACQQACQQVLSQNPQAMQTINPQTITQPFLNTQQPLMGQFGTSYGVTPFVGFQPQLQQGACVGCLPGTQQWGNTIGFQGGFGQVQPQQPWIASTYGTW